MSICRIDYCQFLLSSQINFTMTHFADHSPGFSHDSVNRMLRREKFSSRLVWEHVKGDIVFCPNACLVFDDSILDKNHSHSMELVRLQYSGNAHGLIKGIGMVNCLYVNPDTGQYWLVDYRIFAPDDDGKTKLDHVHDMLTRSIADKQLPFTHVLMDTWYATKELMLLVESLGKFYICPLKSNRLVDDSVAEQAYRRVDELVWSVHENLNGKVIKIRSFPRNHKVRLFRVADSHRTDWIVTNDPAQMTTQVVQDVCTLRWKIEQLHRELKQTTGIEKCQARKARIQRNHIACAVLVWIRLTKIARNSYTTIYRIKHDLLSNYLRQELRSPAVSMKLA